MYCEYTSCDDYTSVPWRPLSQGLQGNLSVYACAAMTNHMCTTLGNLEHIRAQDVQLYQNSRSHYEVLAKDMYKSNFLLYPEVISTGLAWFVH